MSSQQVRVRDHAGASDRALAPDLARGAMLLLIALANVSAYLWGRPTTGAAVHPEPTNAADAVLRFVMTVMVDGRALPMFSFLFGYGMVQFAQARRARHFPEDTIRRFLRRRHLALIAFGVTHAALLFHGDVLGTYGLIGLGLVALLFGRRERTLRVWAWVLFALAVIVAVGTLIGGLWLNSIPATAADIEAQRQVDAAYLRLFEPMLGDVSYASSVAPRLWMWFIVWLQSVFSEIPLCILLGWLAARRGLLDRPWEHRTVLRRIAVGGLAIGWLGGLPEALLGAGVITLRSDATWAFFGLTYTSGAFAGIGYAALFGLLAARIHDRGGFSHGLLLRAIQAIGRRSLTFYLWQSVVFAPLLCGWGLGLGRTLTTTGALALAAVVWAAGIPLALMLESHGRRGPAEVVLRFLSYGRRR